MKIEWEKACHTEGMRRRPFLAAKAFLGTLTAIRRSKCGRAGENKITALQPVVCFYATLKLYQLNAHL